MHVFFDVGSLVGNPGLKASRSGIFRASEVLLEALVHFSDIDIEPAVFDRLLTFYLHSLNPATLSLVEKLGIGKSHFQTHLPAYKKQKIFRYPGLFKLLDGVADWDRLVRSGKRLGNTDCILHSPSLNSLPGKFTSHRVRRVVTIYDLAPVYFPHFFRGTQSVHLFSQLLNNIRPDDYVFCCSESTRRDLLAELPRLDPQRVAVNYLAASSFFKPVRKTPAVQKEFARMGIDHRPFFLAASTIEPRKNVPFLVESFCHFVQQTKSREAILVISGAAGWQYNETMATAMQKVPSTMRNRILFVQHVSDEILRALYSGCIALVYPSLYEGFGLPILEAMSCGAPIIASNVASIPEVVGDAWETFSPHDLDAFAGAMHKAVDYSAEQRQRHSARSIRRAKVYSLQRLAERTVKGYRAAYSS